MNVLYLLTTVIKTQTAPTLMDPSCALVMADMGETEVFAKVNRKQHYQSEIRTSPVHKIYGLACMFIAPC